MLGRAQSNNLARIVCGHQGVISHAASTPAFWMAQPAPRPRWQWLVVLAFAFAWDDDMDTPAEAVRRLLMNTPADALCDACLAVACGTTPIKMEPITAALRQEASFARGARCASCRRTGPTTRALPKCTHCGLRIGAGDPGFVMEGDRFHIHCIKRLLADETIRLSHAVNRRARALIEESRRRMRNGHGRAAIG
jgi:hypothetical protein